MFTGTMPDNKSMIICTPESKLYKEANAWVDITTVQYAIMNAADIALVSVRTEGNRIIYIDFNQLKVHLSERSMLNNTREGDHWKLHIWPNKVQVIGGNIINIPGNL